MKGLIFDLDGVLVDSMPTHYKAWKIAFDETTSLQVDERSIYLLEGYAWRGPRRRNIQKIQLH